MFLSEDTYVNHLGGKKHIKAAKDHKPKSPEQNE
jgi:hypothetical protein